MMVQTEPEQVEVPDVEVEIQQEQDVEKESSEQQDVMTESEDEIEETFVSAAEMFIQADKDDDGSISPEELAEAAGISVEESQELHKSADKDGDGEMSLSEFVASPAVEKVASNLPRPVAPVRKPVNRSEPNTQQVLPSQNSTPRPIPPQNVAPQPVVRNPQSIRCHSRYHSKSLSNKCGISQFNQQSVRVLIAVGVELELILIGVFVRFAALKILTD